MEKAVDSGDRLKLTAILPFSIVNLPVAALNIAVFVYLPPYFTAQLGVGLALVGGVWMAIRLIDIPVDVLLALSMDRTRTRVGRYRPWLVAGSPILALGLWRLFFAPHGFSGVYLFGWLMVLYLGMSATGLAQNAWGATLATRYHDRSRLFGINAAVGVAGALAVLLIPVIGQALGVPDATSIRFMGATMAIAVPLCAIATALLTPERVRPDHAQRAVSARDYLSVLSRPEVLRLFFAQAAVTLGPGWMAALYLFFFKDARGFDQGAASLLLAIFVLAGIPGALLTAALARRVGKHRTLMISTTVFSLSLLSVFITPKGLFVAAIPAMLVLGATSAGFGLMIQAMLADVGDEVRLEQGRERISLLYALNGLAQKIATAFSIGLTFPLLAALGYRAQAGVHNTREAIDRLTAAFIGGPILFVMLGGACVIGWRLDAARQEKTRAALAERDLGFQAALS